MSIKRLRSVIHSTAHHAARGLSWLHPHLGNACSVQDLSQISVNLLKFGFSPEIENVSRELELSTNGLREKFKEILSSENISPSSLQKADAYFQFGNDNWQSTCAVVVETIDGQKLESAVDFDGKSAEILHHDS